MAVTLPAVLAIADAAPDLNPHSVAAYL
jgi:hypothetical protein